MNSPLENKGDSSLKLFHAGGDPKVSYGFRGCEQDNIVLHFSDCSNSGYLAYELFSRARKNLIVILSKKYLEEDDPFSKTIKEILRHEENCKSPICREHQWYNKKVMDWKDRIYWTDEIIDVGLTHESSLSGNKLHIS